MKINKIGVFVLLTIFLLAFVSSQSSFTGASTSYSFVNHQYSQPSFQTYYGNDNRLSTYWPILNDKEVCEARQDIMIQISPAGCQPMVVRSDLLADQNVAVFCQIDALQLNPLIDVKEIRNIRFTGKYPDGVVSAGFHPARAALRTNDILLGNPVVNNIGYVVVVLKRQGNESNLPDSYVFNLTAQIDYQADNAYGIGKAEFILKPQSDAEWESDKSQQTFWQGRYSVRLIDADTNKAVIGLYQGDTRITSTTVERGKTSNQLYLPGFYCQAGLQVAYDGFVAPQDKAILTVRDEKGIERIDGYSGTDFLNNKCTVRSVSINSDSITGSTEIVCGSQRFTLSLLPKSSEQLLDKAFTKDAIGIEQEKYYREAIRQFESIAQDYPSEKKDQSVSELETYGEQALVSAVNLAEQYSQSATQTRLMNLYLEIYPSGVRAIEYTNKIESLRNSDFSRASAVVNVGSRTQTIYLEGFQKYQSQASKAKATMVVGGEQKTLLLKVQQAAFASGTINVTYIDDRRVQFTYRCESGSNSQSSSVSVGNSVTICRDNRNNQNGQVVSLISVQDIDKNAKIRLIPSARGPTTETNLTVAIGIEKRAIKLSPEEALDRIENLNKSIDKWEGISENLGNVVTGLKGACFATAAVLTVKNFIEGVGGEALARNHAMSGENGWTKKCEGLINQGQYKTLTQCYNGEADKIDAEVAARTNALRDVNNRIETNQKTFPSSSGVIDPKASKLAYAQSLRVKYPNSNIPTDEASLEYYSIADLRELDYQYSLKNNNAVSQTVVNNKITSLESKLTASKQTADQIKAAQSATGIGITPTTVGALRNAQIVTTPVYDVKDGKINGKTVSGLPEGKSVAYISGSTLERTPTGEIMSEPKQYLIAGTKTTEGRFIPETVYNYNSDGSITNSGETATSVLTKYQVSEIRPATAQRLNNPIIAQSQKVSYFGYGPYEGLPAIVPFDLARGWYARVNPVTAVGNQNPNYDSSGSPKIFDICNVGENGAIDDGSDNCQRIYVGVNDNSPISGLDDRESRDLIARAKQALLDAGSQKGSSTVKINGQNLLSGQNVAHASGVQCQEFMSPDDCKILFNMCDPVICPTSRCNLGGKYPVDDVIQSGIVGSALLCLPNAQEGIVIPVCLTGIQAGVDGYLSVLKSHRDCLSESVRSGQMVGICDQIYSIYLCDFFWRQFAPVANALLPKIVEFFYDGGQSARGGGEYLTVGFAWQNTQKSVDYFTQSYAVNSLKAFQARSVQDVGAQVCKGFVSAGAPTDFKTLLEPDSPPQFFAQFDAIRYSDATVPATAQYKVFYHIYSGKDFGAQYSVYLKNPPQSSSYASTPQIVVDSGYVNRGQTVSKTRDFTAPEGYKELCVLINGEEECGFKQVTTDFSLNYLKDSYVADQVTNTDIQSERECISGTPDLKALTVNSNLQSGGEEAGLPQISDRGVVRICSSGNPGLSTNPARYVEVGVCDANLKCWLDTQSAKNAITDNNKGLQGQVLNDLNKTVVANLEKQGAIVDSSDGRYTNSISKLKDEKETIVNSVNPVVNDFAKISTSVKNFVNQYNIERSKLVLNSHKAQFATLSAELYRDIAVKLFTKTTAPVIGPSQLSGEVYLRYNNGWQYSDSVNGDWRNVRGISESDELIGSPLERYLGILINLEDDNKESGSIYLQELQDLGDASLTSDPGGLFGLTIDSQISSSSQTSSQSPSSNQNNQVISYKLSQSFAPGFKGKNFLIINGIESQFYFDGTNFKQDTFGFDKVIGRLSITPERKLRLSLNADSQDILGENYKRLQGALISTGSNEIEFISESIGTGELLENVFNLNQAQCTNRRTVTWTFENKEYNVQVCVDDDLLANYESKYGEFTQFCRAPSVFGDSNKVFAPEYRPFSVFVDDVDGSDYLEDIAYQLKILGERDYSGDEYKQKAFVSSFIRNAAMYKDDSACVNCVDRPAYPYEVVAGGFGDCEDSAILLATLFERFGWDYQFVLWKNSSTHHLNNIVLCESCQINIEPYSYDGKKYYVLDSTAADKIEEYTVDSRWKTFESIRNTFTDSKIVNKIPESYLVMSNLNARYVGSFFRATFDLSNRGANNAEDVRWAIYFDQSKLIISDNDYSGPNGEDLLLGEGIIVDRLDREESISVQLDTNVETPQTGIIKLYISDSSGKQVLYSYYYKYN